ncbi:hypothetical protein Pelo_8480 [Pelomyxa schiedti]|nr:hypothetical protein Pelo_8480 [Pelomyxa schiedti]
MEAKEIAVQVPLAFVTGIAAASLGVSAWMLMVPIMMIQGWELYDVLFIVGCMDIVSSSVMTGVYLIKRYVWRSPFWIIFFACLAATEISLIVGLLHDFIKEHLGIFEKGSGLFAFVIGGFMLLVGIVDTVKKLRARSKGKQAAEKKKSAAVNPSDEETTRLIVNHDTPSQRICDEEAGRQAESGTKLDGEEKVFASSPPPIDPTIGAGVGGAGVEEPVDAEQRRTSQHAAALLSGVMSEIDERKLPVNWILLRKLKLPVMLTRALMIFWVALCWAVVGYLGWGSGTVFVILLGLHTDAALRTATGTASLMMLVSSSVFTVNVAAWQLANVGSIWDTLLCCLAAQLVGTVVGTIVVFRIPTWLIKTFIGLVLVGIGVVSEVSYILMATSESTSASQSLSSHTNFPSSLSSL